MLGLSNYCLRLVCRLQIAIKDEPCAQKDAHTHSCACTIASQRTPSCLRLQFGADLLISIATITAVGGGDIMKIDCHKKATMQQKEGGCNGGVSQSAAVLLGAG